MIDPNRERYVSLATIRKNGQEVRTPVWIAAVDGEPRVYTNITSGKVKRIKNNPKVRVAPCNVRGELRGEWVDATAHVVDDDTERDRGIRAFIDKYGWQMRLALWLSRLSGRYRDRAIIALEFSEPR